MVIWAYGSRGVTGGGKAKSGRAKGSVKGKPKRTSSSVKGEPKGLVAVKASPAYKNQVKAERQRQLGNSSNKMSGAATSKLAGQAGVSNKSMIQRIVSAAIRLNAAAGGTTEG